MKRPLLPWLVLTMVSAACSAAAPAKGPLRVHPQNPRYFTDSSGKAIYLTGSHTWSNLQDQGAKDPPPKFDYGRYLDFLQKHHHNFIRMWAWEQARWAPWSDGKGENPGDWFVAPNPYCRTGPGVARDGKPKFDLAEFDPAYFHRLRERVQKAGERGIYVSVMLFQGWSSAKAWLGGRPWLGHPYHPDNNTQGFNGNRKSDVGPDLSDPQVRNLQAAYLRKVVDTVNDLDNVLYEVTNEGGAKDWDWWVVRTVQEYENTKAKQHPVGLTGHGSESNEDMLASPAAWISPGSSGWRDLTANPRPAPGTKVSLLDTDHVFGVGGDQKWVWKGFLRGHNVLFMDPYDDPEWAPILVGQNVGVRDAEAPRRAMGVARHCAERMDLAASTPKPELASTGFCLAVPGKEYLVYLPEGGEVRVDLSAGKGRFAIEWVHPLTGKSASGGTVDGGNWRTLRAPFGGDAALLLSRHAAPHVAVAPTERSSASPAHVPARIQLRTISWRFDAAQPAQSVLTARTPQAEFAAPADAAQGFTLKLTAALKPFDGERSVLEIPGVLSVRLRQHDRLNRERQNYPAFKMPDGSVPVLEARLMLHSIEHPEWKEMTIGIPLARLKNPAGEHEIVLQFCGVRWTMYVDGELLDNDFPFGYPRWPAKNTWKLNGDFVKQAALYLPAVKPQETLSKTPRAAPVQYWTPPGHNSWVGDVVTFFHRGRYHVFYLYDRRHHQSKFGQGAHYFEHLSTTDFKTWTEHEAATPLEEQWECIGTGTPFVFDGKFCIGYGLHTGRVYPEQKTTWPAQWEYLKQNGRSGGFRRTAIPGFPAGSTYSVSADGVSRFTKSQIVFHPCQNPSVYTDPRGRLRLLANAGSKGIWESETVDGGWRCLSPDFPPGGDCTFFFRWGKFDYIIGGFQDLWSKPADAPDSAYEDVVRRGLDFYDGLNVPAITEIDGGRFLMAGWTNIRGWGGHLVIRQLLQSPDGRIGSKWMEEIMPETKTPKTLAATMAETATFPVEGRSFLLTLSVQPADASKGRLGISFLPDNGEQGACELQVRLDDRRAQFGPGSVDRFAGSQKSLRERGSPHGAGDYAIENLIGVAGPFTVRILVNGDDKIGGSLIDAEIAGQRTMLSYRPDLAVKKLVFRTERLELKNVQIAPLLAQEGDSRQH